jgi:exportin-1
LELVGLPLDLDLIIYSLPFFSAQIKAFVDGMFRLYQDQNAFKLHVRDFLIQLKEFAGDNADLFLDEREAEAEEKRREEFESRKAVPGLLKPSER